MKKSPLSLSELFFVFRSLYTYHHSGLGFLILVMTLLFLSVLAGLNTPVQNQHFVAGEIAENDLIAHRNLMIEDKMASRRQRDRIAAQQPVVFDLSPTESATLRNQMYLLIKEINTYSSSSEGDRSLATLSKNIALQLGSEVDDKTIEALLDPHVQDFVIGTALPWFERRLIEGVVTDSRQSLPQRGDLIIRNLATGEETLRNDVTHILDIPTLLIQFSHVMRDDPRITRASQRALDQLFVLLLKPTLTVNRDATNSLVSGVLETVNPVFYHVQKGEVLVYKGERISYEAQTKLQALYHKGEGYLHKRTVGGLFVIALFLTAGFFMAPSGRRGSQMRRKDFLFIALLLLFFGVFAKGAYTLAGQLLPQTELLHCAYAFPLAGAAGLCALIFAAKRYCVIGLLLAFFCTLLMKGGLPTFLFFYLSAMLNTWLVLRAQTRQDVVWSVVPLALGLVFLSLGSGWLEGLRGADDFLILAGIAVGNAFLSVLLLFALSPILELVFGYTTRFRLMELMNLEQPLLQELMMTIPGTYHHSLVVANMVEAGAKAVGANSLLCKVAALYHDIGKLAYPDYFIENQFRGINKHDKLAPAMSALILCSHVKKGTELARKHRVGDEIEAIIRQHHGTGLMRYFYKKALDHGDQPRREDFSYPGPRPQTREAAIIMLADVVEASSRAMNEPTPARIRTHIDSIIKGIFADGQLDESELTFKDLHALTECFVRILMGIFHQRIVYPEVIRKTDTNVPHEVATPDNHHEKNKNDQTDRPLDVKEMPQLQAKKKLTEKTLLTTPTQKIEKQQNIEQTKKNTDDKKIKNNTKDTNPYQDDEKTIAIDTA